MVVEEEERAAAAAASPSCRRRVRRAAGPSPSRPRTWRQSRSRRAARASACTCVRRNRGRRTTNGEHTHTHTHAHSLARARVLCPRVCVRVVRRSERIQVRAIVSVGASRSRRATCDVLTTILLLLAPLSQVPLGRRAHRDARVGEGFERVAEDERVRLRSSRPDDEDGRRKTSAAAHAVRDERDARGRRTRRRVRA